MVKFEMPEGVSEETKKFMADVVKELNKKKVIQNIDLGAMRMLACSYELYRQATDKLLEQGPTVQWKEREIMNPCQDVATKNYAQVMKVMTEYGLTIKSRSNIKTMKQENTGETSLDKFFKKKAKRTVRQTGK